jgi:hypothetical protein
MATRIEDAHVNQILSRWYITMFVLEFPDLPAVSLVLQVPWILILTVPPQLGP